MNTPPKRTRWLAILFGVVALLSLPGCKSSENRQVVASDPLAAKDPNAKGRELLKQFADAEDPSTWVQQNAFALTVFQQVTDPQVKADFDSKIAPLMVHAK